VRRPPPEARRSAPAGGDPVWAALAAGASAGVAVVAFLDSPWPWGLLAMPALVVWALLLSAMSGPGGWRRPGNALLLVGLTAVALGAVAIGLLALLVS
jgi:hypothetical protein